jgi:hypothetical protein
MECVLPGLEESLADEIADAIALVVLDDEREVGVFGEGERYVYGWLGCASEWGEEEAGEDEEARTKAQRHEGFLERGGHEWTSVICCQVYLVSITVECADWSALWIVFGKVTESQSGDKSPHSIERPFALHGNRMLRSMWSTHSVSRSDDHGESSPL